MKKSSELAAARRMESQILAFAPRRGDLGGLSGGARLAPLRVDESETLGGSWGIPWSSTPPSARLRHRFQVISSAFDDFQSENA